MRDDEVERKDFLTLDIACPWRHCSEGAEKRAIMVAEDLPPDS